LALHFENGCFGAAALLRQWRVVFIVNIASAIFHCSAPDLDSCPDESLPEFAFIGRSNVGKSSLLNMLAGKDGLARVSPTPGFTKLINIFTMNKTWRLVDLPGYGFAQVARKAQTKFNRAVAGYLQHRPNLVCVFTLIDSGLPPQRIDLEFVEWLINNSIPFVLVFTKSDTVTATTAQTNIAAFSEHVSAWCEKLPEIYTCSARTRQGRTELLQVVADALAASQDEAATESEEAESDAALPPEDLPAPKLKASPPGNPRKRPNPARPW